MMAGGRHLVKYEGAGNDFLVVVDAAGNRPLDASEVRVLCDRRRGLGSDGVLRLFPGAGGAALSMELRNADGSRAEMSGNGVRCLVHAAVDAELVAAGEVTVATDAGHRSVRISLDREPGVAVAEVVMGRPRLVPPPVSLPFDVPARRVRWVDMGNPHVVVVVDEIDPGLVARWGAAAEAAVPGGTNVEVVRVLDRHQVVMAVWERGVGTTLACGTGSCAVAAACWDCGLAGDPLVVQNPGGPLTVSREAESVVLRGPSRRVASVVVDEAILVARAAELRSKDGAAAGAAAGR